jgi:ADP-ribose pyrophosphatase YjhB (NUDIX family)
VSRVATAGRTRLGAYAVCVDERGRVLLCRTAPGYPVEGVWTLPGGGVDFGEHPDVALLRELAEETGLAGGIEEVVMVWSRLIPPEETASGEPLHVVGIIYRVSIVGRGEPRTEVGGSTDACGWFALDEVAGMPVAAYAREAMARALPAPDG